MVFGAGILRVIDGMLSVVIAPLCAVCDVPLDSPSRGAVCDGCWGGILPFGPPLCDKCGDPLASWRVISVEEGRCPRCRRGPAIVSFSRAIGAYEGPLRSIVHALKYDHRRSLAPRVAQLMQRHCGDVLGGADVLVPVPLHRRRARQRGFNQSEDLAMGLGLRIVHALRRTRATASQTDLPAARRHANVRDAFVLRGRVDVRGRCVLLVDDVSTTGATLDACARPLLAAGAREVRAITAARVVSRPR